MAGLADLEERIVKLEVAAADIKDATREAHEAIKTLRILKRDIKKLLDDTAPAMVDEAIGEAVRTGLAKYADTITTAQTAAVEQVNATFNELAKIYLEGSGKHDGLPLPDLAAQARKRRQTGS